MTLSRIKILKWISILSNSAIAIANMFLVVLTLGALYYAYQANARAERLYVGENRPLIDVTPITIRQNAEGTHARTTLSIANYSGFKARNMGFDLQYGSRGWISEWLKAWDERREKGNAQGVVREKDYNSQSNLRIYELRPGQTTTKDQKGDGLEFAGALHLESDVCGKGEQGLPVFVRVTWQNVNGHVFDEVHRYRLICTKATDQSGPAVGISFTFIPEGVTSRKDAPSSG